MADGDWWQSHRLIVSCDNDELMIIPTEHAIFILHAWENSKFLFHLHIYENIARFWWGTDGISCGSHRPHPNLSCFVFAHNMNVIVINIIIIVIVTQHTGLLLLLFYDTLIALVRRLRKQIICRSHISGFVSEVSVFWCIKWERRTKKKKWA